MKPVATLHGDEIAPLDADLPTLRQAARAFYASQLRDEFVYCDALDRHVQFRGSRKSFSASANPEKLRVFAALRDIIAKGHLDNSQPPRDQSIEPSTRAYHYLTALVELDGRFVRVGATIRENAAGCLYYNHSVTG